MKLTKIERKAETFVDGVLECLGGSKSDEKSNLRKLDVIDPNGTLHQAEHKNHPKVFTLIH